MFLFWTLPTVILLVNHYHNLKGILLEYNELQQEFFYSKNNTSLKFKKTEIIEINQYNHGGSRIPWSDIYVWKIKVKEQEIKLSNIVISKKGIIKLFWDKSIKNNFKFFVTI